VTVAFHGHAHNGSHAGHTSDGVPVFNVALPLLKRDAADTPGFILYEIPPFVTKAKKASSEVQNV